MLNLPVDFDKQEDGLGFLLWQTTITRQRLIKKALESNDISYAQFVIMAILLWFEAHNYDITQVFIINWSKLDKMTVSKSLKKLVSKKLVYQTEHTTDTRAKSVSLTNKGKVLVPQIASIVEQIDSEFFGKLPDHNQKSLVQILNKLVIDRDRKEHHNSSTE